MQSSLVALSIAQGITQLIGETTSAASQKSSNQQLRQNALDTRTNDLATIEARRQEERDAASQKLQQSQQQAMAERSSALAASAESGQSGLSVSALLNDYLRKSLDNEQAIRTNLNNVDTQLDRERQSVINTAQSRINATPSVTNPSFISSALKIGGDAYKVYQATKPPQAPTPTTVRR